MKKIFTLIITAMVAVCSYAQVNFTDPSGKAYGDGEVMTLRSEIDEDWGDLVMPSPTLVNTSNAQVSVQMDVNIVELPEGTALSDCFSGSCTNYIKLGSHKTSVKTIPANGKLKTQIEWNFYSNKISDNVNGTCIVEFTIYVNGNKDKTVKVHYVNGETDGVKNITLGEKSQKAVFTLDGKRVGEMTKGLVVRNGKKVIVK
ncbi:MAG: hypothetical protein KBT39_02130 [Bacteroidales bacterium]|nr:hypothetical protein [Bacteroidales bacterium]